MKLVYFWRHWVEAKGVAANMDSLFLEEVFRRSVLKKVWIISQQSSHIVEHSEGNDNRDVASFMAARHWCVRWLFANLENVGGHHLEGSRPKPSLKSSIFRPHLGNRDHRTFNGVVQKPGCYRCGSMPYIFLVLFAAIASENQDGKICLCFFWEVSQDETLKEACLRMLHEPVFFCFETISFKFQQKTSSAPT